MPTRTLVSIAVHDRPGLLAAVAETLSSEGVEIEGFSLDQGTILLLADDDSVAQESLQAAGHVVESIDCFVVEADNTPGTRARVTSALAQGGIDGLLTFGAGDPQVVYVPVQHRERALSLLGKIRGVRIPD